MKKFIKDVQEWARVRKIYDQSTELRQKAGAIEEIAEYLIAETREEKMLELGDIAVFLVNAAFLANEELTADQPAVPYFTISGLSHLILREHSLDDESNSRRYNICLKALSQYCGENGYDFDEILARTWEKIKDRKGMMIYKKFVKWESMTEDQRKEFLDRDSGNTLIRGI